MPFGLANAPAVFQALVNDVLRDMLNQFFVYLEDILIFSPHLETHKDHVRQVLQKLLQHQLYIKAEKCEFLPPLCPLWVSSFRKGSMDPEKVRVVQNWPTWTNQKQLQRVLGFANFCHKFLRNFNLISSPRTHLPDKSF